MDLFCYRDGVRVDCNNELLNGTVVRPRCITNYTLEGGNHPELYCKFNGEWSGQLLECVQYDPMNYAECGKSETSQSNQIIDTHKKSLSSTDDNVVNTGEKFDEIAAINRTEFS